MVAHIDTPGWQHQRWLTIKAHGHFVELADAFDAFDLVDLVEHVVQLDRLNFAWLDLVDFADLLDEVGVQPFLTDGVKFQVERLVQPQ
jgi:hypothetical protein